MTSATWQRRTKEMPQNYDFFIMTLDHNEHNYLGERVKFTGNFSGHLGSILLRNVSLQDEGIYTCILNIFPSGPYETELYLTVLGPPIVTVNVAVHPVAGDTDELLPTCTAANSKPAAKVSWNLGALRDSVEVQINHTVDSEGRYTVTSSLISKKSKDLKQENVHCLVSHPGLKEKMNYTLAIHYPPQVVYISPSGPTEFHCEADAYPKRTYFSWSRCLLMKEPLSSGDTNTLIIQPTPDSHGCYYCMASNQYGKSVCLFNVQFKSNAKSTTPWIWIIFIVLLFSLGCCIFAIWRIYEFLLNFIERQR